MTKDDIIRMAREACGEPAWDGGVEWTWEELERFAALVYTEGHKDGLDDFEAGVLPAAIKAEREAAIEDARTVGGEAGAEMEKLIRARGQG